MTINDLVKSANDQIDQEIGACGYFARRDNYKLSRQFLPILEQELEAIKDELNALDINAACNIFGDHMSSAPSIVLAISINRNSDYRQRQLFLRDSVWNYNVVRLVDFKQTYVRQSGSRILSLHHAELADKKNGNETVLAVCKKLRRDILRELSRMVQDGIRWTELVEKYGAAAVKNICDGYIAMSKNTDLHISLLQKPEREEFSSVWNSCMLNPENMELFRTLAAKLDSEDIS